MLMDIENLHFGELFTNQCAFISPIPNQKLINC
jgi:hypothetical protein